MARTRRARAGSCWGPSSRRISGPAELGPTPLAASRAPFRRNAKIRVSKPPLTGAGGSENSSARSRSSIRRKTRSRWAISLVSAETTPGGAGGGGVSDAIVGSAAGAIRAELAQDERVVERHLAQVIVPTGRAAVARVHVDLEQQRAAVGLEGPELRHVLGGLPVHHLAVVERGPDEHRRVRLGLEVRVRAVAAHVLVLLADLRVAPLLELAHGERQRLV